MKRFLSIAILSLGLVAMLAGPAIPTTSSIAAMPNADQSLARTLWGAMASDPWVYTFTGADSVSYAWCFVTPDSSDTLLADAGYFWLTPAVDCTLTTHNADSTLWIGNDPMPVKAGEMIQVDHRTSWIHIGSSGAGLVRACALAY